MNELFKVFIICSTRCFLAYSFYHRQILCLLLSRSKFYYDVEQWRSQRGQFGATTPKGLGRPVGGRPFAINFPLLVPIEVETEIKRYSKLNIAFHFVELQDLRDGCLPSLYYRMAITMLLFRNSTTVVISLPSENCPALR